MLITTTSLVVLKSLPDTMYWSKGISPEPWHWNKIRTTLTCYVELKGYLKRTGTKTYENLTTLALGDDSNFESPQIVACRSYFVGFQNPVAMVDELKFSPCDTCEGHRRSGDLHDQ